MQAIIAIIFWTISILLPSNAPTPNVVVIPPMPHVDPINIWVVEEDEDGDWHAFEMDAYLEYCDEFTALFNSYTYKVSKNGRSMINGKFVKKG